MATLDRAVRIAAQAHAGQKDRYGDSYILHPLRMMVRMSDEKEMIVAVLHDVVEKSEWTLDALCQEGFSEEIIEAVDCLTKRSQESYDDHIDRTKKNVLAKRVKLADLEDNLNQVQTKGSSKKDSERLARYHKAWLKIMK